ncbi:hypothetical protein BD770DRAFT_425732 [Pilaira anomala]|nr:hypothetical protein BD770DRAFT_425732 [Pilaira anomala]
MDDHIKEEKKKKSHKKRDKFWKFIFPHSKPKKLNQVTNNNQEQTEKINSLTSYAQTNFSITLDPDVVQTILENNRWDYKRALTDIVDYEEASHGILIEPSKDLQFIKLLGSENDGGTSCYIDALLFAMFIYNTTFDPLLTYDIAPEFENKIKLQTFLRLFVNKLRKGHLVYAEFVHWLRKVLEEAQWTGRNDHGEWTQEDASELFMFITETFELPYLPFQIRLFHGANKDTDDDRVMTDRMLALCVPNDVKKILLQDILLDYFYNSIITGVRRQVDSESTPDSILLPNDGDTQKKESTLYKDNKHPSSFAAEEEGISVTAWQVLEFLPFYSASNEQGISIDTQVDSSFPDTHMILPIVLKRYSYDNFGGSTKIRNHVEIPVTIDFNKFVNQNADDPMCPTCGHIVNWTLHFKSAVCHHGESPYAGHYISYARIMDEDDTNSEPYWLKFDDMNASSRITVIQDKHAAPIFQDLAANAYIIFYELDKTCRHDDDDDGSMNEVTDRKEDDSKSPGSFTETDSDEDDFDTNGKLPNKRKHHRHHRNHHLSESCHLM